MDKPFRLFSALDMVKIKIFKRFKMFNIETLDSSLLVRQQSSGAAIFASIAESSTKSSAPAQQIQFVTS